MRRVPVLLLAVAIVWLASLPATAAAQSDPYAGDVFNILVPGQTGSLPPDRNGRDQMRLYDALTPLFDKVSMRTVRRLYKSERFGGRGRVERTTNRNVRIVRDSFGVPHITADKRADVIFGMGWVTGEDRGLLLEFARYAGRVAAVDAPGVNAFSLITTARRFRPAPQAEAVLSGQINLMRRRYGAEGREMVKDIDAFTRGINAFYKSTDNPADPWRRNDVLALAGMIGDIFGEGGGDEVRNAQLLGLLQQRLGNQGGFGAWNDLMRADEAEAVTTLSKRFPYGTPPKGPTPGSATVDPDTISAAAVRAAAAENPRKQASNALLVAARRSETGHPLAVMGPQLGYFYPEIVMEMDLHGGGIDARGVVVPGTPYMLIGRGRDYAWSLTSANNDVTDQYLDQLCNPDGSPPTRDSRGYMYKGTCRPMGSFNAGTIDGNPPTPVTFRTTVHGPVSGTVLVGGRPFAIAKKRSGSGRDVAGGLKALKDLSENDVRSARDFPRVANQFDWTFNWHYVDDRDIAFFSSGYLPIRPKNTNSYLPTLGTGQFEWRGFLKQEDHPQAINPSEGIILNWNGRPAPGWVGGDDLRSWGSVQRVQLFKGFKKRGNELNDVVAIMNRAGTQDLRVVKIWPLIREMLARASAPDALSKQAADLVTAWERAKGSRLDRNLDGKVDDPGAVILDAAWPKLARALFAPVLGDLTERLDAINDVDDSPDTGDQFGGGWYGYLDKDLRSLLGKRVKGPFSRRYCGGGNVPACASSLWAAIQQATQELSAAQGPNPAAWRQDARRERHDFVPGLITDTIRWVNRPTFQQAVQFDGHRRRPRSER